MSKFDTLAEIPVRPFGSHGRSRPSGSRAFAAEVLSLVAKTPAVLAEGVRTFCQGRSGRSESSAKRFPPRFVETIGPLVDEYMLDEQDVVEALRGPLTKMALFVQREPSRPINDEDVHVIAELIRDGRGHMFLD